MKAKKKQTGNGGFRDLQAWKVARRLVQHVYPTVLALQRRKQFELCDQLRRSLFSVPLNIAEGHGVESNRNFARHVRIARGSLAEVEAILVLIDDLDLLREPVLPPTEPLLRELGRLTHGLLTYLTNQSRK